MFCFDKPGTYDVHIDAGGADLRLDQLLAQGAQILMAITDIKAAMDRIDVATTAIGKKLEALAGRVGTGMSEADVATVVSGLQAEATKLEGMGKDEAPAS